MQDADPLVFPFPGNAKKIATLTDDAGEYIVGMFFHTLFQHLVYHECHEKRHTCTSNACFAQGA